MRCRQQEVLLALTRGRCFMEQATRLHVEYFLVSRVIIEAIFEPNGAWPGCHDGLCRQAGMEAMGCRGDHALGRCAAGTRRGCLWAVVVSGFGGLEAAWGRGRGLWEGGWRLAPRGSHAATGLGAPCQDQLGPAPPAAQYNMWKIEKTPEFQEKFNAEDAPALSVQLKPGRSG